MNKTNAAVVTSAFPACRRGIGLGAVGGSIMALALLLCFSAQGTTLISKMPNASVLFGLPFASLEFENLLTGTEMVLSHKVLEWRDADYSKPGHPLYDDWSVNAAGGTINGNVNEIWMRQQGQSIWTTTTVPSTIVSIHLVGDDNDGLADVLVDGVIVARLDMYNPQPPQTALIIVRGLSNITHHIEVQDVGAGSGGGSDVATLGAAALAESDIKWDQPPLPANPDNIFYGWNEPSTEGMSLIAADDWVCTNAAPITKIRWWGSYLNWQGQYPPQTIQGFQIRFWTDVPQGADPELPFSHPGVQVGPEIYCQNFTEQFVGWDYDPRTRCYEACYLYEQTLTPSEYFYQDPLNGTNIYWISIAAVLQDPTYLWGWKTRPRDPESPAPDDAVIFDPNAPPPGVYAPLYWPTETDSWDLAFELISETEIMAAKWWQVPDLTPEGMDVHASDNPNAPPPNLLADDFQCTSQEPITHITIWGSWTNDFDWQNVIFKLSIHDDIPASQSPTGYSMPGALRWQRNFSPGQFGYFVYAGDIEEWWFTPPSIAKFPGDHICYQYDFSIPAQEAFYQEGDPANPKVYWLDVQAELQAAPPYVLFGWKTCPTNWNDAAVWVNAREPYNGIWQKMTYPPQHPRHGQTVDLAFRLNYGVQFVEQIKWSQPPQPYTPPDGYHGWNEYSVQGQFAADDWVCTNATPVTDIHWWGSFIGWGFPGEPEQAGPELPAGFLIRIWEDVPQGPNNSFSYPSNMVWQTYCTNFAWEFVGWDFDPRDPLALPEACFKYSQDLRPEEWFTQDPKNGTNIYWISIAAVYTNGPPTEYPWGWKTRLRDLNSLAPDDAVRRVAGAVPPWQPIEYPAGTSWDMAFVLTTQEVETPTDDFGDAPDSPAALGYPTLLINSGAQHSVVPGIFMGNLIDAELDGQPTALADGDDLNNLPDEDGVSLAGLLVPGEVANVQVTVSVPGFLSAWLDFNADGSWATLGDQIFTNVPVNAGANALTFNVPLTAAQGSNTFARFRFSTVAGAVATFTGPAPDGEVEDYQWYIEELDFGDAQDPTFATLYANNGARHILAPTIFLGARIDSEADGQPNATATGDDNNPPMALSDEDGVTLLTPLVPGQPATVQVVTTMLGGLMNAPLNAWIDFDADGSWATPGDQVCINANMNPGINLVNFIVPPTAAAGSNVFARFRFSTMPSPPLADAGLAPNGEVEDYLWRIERLDFGDAPDPAYPTRLANNGAHHLPGNLFMGATVDAEADGQPNAFASGDDLAGADDEDGVVFTTALISGVPATVQVTCSAPGLLQGWVDWNQNGSWAEANEQIIANAPVGVGANTVPFFVPNNLPSGKTFARFRLSTIAGLSYTGYAADGEVEDYEVTLYPLKNTQVPEQGSEGVDVSLGTPLADDFICNENGPITDVHIWGSFLNDVLPAGGPGSLTFTLTIYADVPGPGYSRPGVTLWSQTFTPGQYQAANNFTTKEWWHDPAALPPTWIFPGDTNMYQFDFYIDPGEAFRQEEGTIYWLGVSLGGSGANFSFGWKTTPTGYAPDDACWLDIAAGGVWRPLVYGLGHPRSGQSMDLAFALSGAESLFDSDFGDAPNPYPTPAASGGAQHYAVPGFRLGPAEDAEADGIPHPQALGDDLNNLADEDGVAFVPPVLAGTQACVTVTLTGPAGLLDAWVDFNKNGAWDHPSEQIFAGQALFSGANWLCFNVPTNAVLGTNFARFRLSSAGGLAPTGLAQDGEVEDYQLVIRQRRPLTNIVITNIWVTNVNANTQAVSLAWTYENDVHYQVRYAPDLGTNYASNVFWINLGPEIIGPAHTYQDTNNSSTVTQRFYRVVAPYLSP